VSIEVLD